MKSFLWYKRDLRHNPKGQSNMQRKQIRFPLAGVAKAHSLDDLQRALIMDTERCLNALWPDSRQAPAAMHDLHDALCLLLDWTSRNERGRARLRKHYLQNIADLERGIAAHEQQEPSLITHPLALEVVPGILRALLKEEDAQLERDFEPGGAAQLADEVDAWLAVGDC
jgi:hypothetical protein